jgi:hypothetical protein
MSEADSRLGPDEQRLVEIHRMVEDIHFWVKWIFWVASFVAALAVVGGVVIMVALTS